MKYKIEHHDASVPGYQVSVKENPRQRELYSSFMEKNPEGIRLSLNPLYSNAQLSLAIDQNAELPETWEDWVTAMQIHHAVFAMATTPRGAELELMVNHKVRRTTAIAPAWFTDAGNWLAAFFLAISCREEDRVRQLCEIPVDLLRQAGESQGGSYNPYIYHWISALQAYILDRPELGEELLAAMELSDPERADFGDAEFLNKITFPPMKAFLHLVEGDSEEFNRSLAWGLELFREYYTATPERAEEIGGVFPPALLAMACIAHDLSSGDPGFRLEVESGYLPRNIVDRAWEGTFPT